MNDYYSRKGEHVPRNPTNEMFVQLERLLIKIERHLHMATHVEVGFVMCFIADYRPRDLSASQTLHQIYANGLNECFFELADYSNLLYHIAGGCTCVRISKARDNDLIIAYVNTMMKFNGIDRYSEDVYCYELYNKETGESVIVAYFLYRHGYSKEERNYRRAERFAISKEMCNITNNKRIITPRL